MDRRDLAAYERIIELYAPYVLIRCAGHTNSRRYSQQIGAYVLICTCLTLRKLDRLEQPLREAIVLHHVAGREERELTRLLQQPADEVAASSASRGWPGSLEHSCGREACFIGLWGRPGIRVGP